MDEYISKQAVLDALNVKCMMPVWCKVLVEKMLKDLPSAQPERKRGRWTRPSRKNTYERFCSECGDKAWVCGKGDYRFCPNCGSYNRGEKDEAN